MKYQEPKLVFQYCSTIYSVDIGSPDHTVTKLQNPWKGNFADILSCWNGLLFAKVRDYVNPDNYYLWNTMTGDYKTIPEHELDPSVSIKGFGYDFITDEYKVMIADNFAAYIFSMKTNSWKEIKRHGISNGIYHATSCTILHGIPHWMVEYYFTCSTSYYVQSRYDAVLYFGFAEEKFVKMPLPDEIENKKLWGLVVLGDNLCVIFHQIPRDSLAVWTMKEHGKKESWVKLFSVDHRLFQPDNNYPVDILCTTRDGDVVVTMNGTEIGICNVGLDKILQMKTGFAIKSVEFPSARCRNKVVAYREGLVSAFSSSSSTKDFRKKIMSRLFYVICGFVLLLVLLQRKYS
ncbi:hypothetical protein L6164_025555 [Bauhinia variegata]|nr:hypothetical protein L6164_025555 [Bauhinia variegata]